MAILKIARMGHPVLAQRAQDVADPTDPAIARLVADMVETMMDAEGTGLAAPQVEVPLRVVVFQVAAARNGGEAVPLTVLVNPWIKVVDESLEAAYEGCLSVPGLTGVVPRYAAIRYGGVGLDGKPIERQARGFHARVVQHECDHLDGLLYPARMSDLASFGFVEEVRQREMARSDGNGG